MDPPLTVNGNGADSDSPELNLIPQGNQDNNAQIVAVEHSPAPNLDQQWNQGNTVDNNERHQNSRVNLSRYPYIHKLCQQNQDEDRERTREMQSSVALKRQGKKSRVLPNDATMKDVSVIPLEAATVSTTWPTTQWGEKGDDDPDL